MRISILVVAAIAMSCTCACAGPFANGDFETGAMSPWFYAHYGPAPYGDSFNHPDVVTHGILHVPLSTHAAAHSGQYMLGMSTSAPMAGQKQAAMQAFNVTPGSVIDISAYVAGGIGNYEGTNFTGAGWWELRVLQGMFAGVTSFDDGTVLWRKDIAVAGGFDWTPASGQVTATGSVVTIMLAYGGTDPAWATTYFGSYLDDVTVTAVPEPGTLLALATGLAMMLGAAKRKR